MTIQQIKRLEEGAALEERRVDGGFRERGWPARPNDSDYTSSKKMSMYLIVISDRTQYLV